MRVAAVLVAISVFALLPRLAAAQEITPVGAFVEIEAGPLFTEPAGPIPPAWQRSSTDWRYVGWGVAAGAVAGAIWGTVVMKNADDWVAPPAHMFTIPVGALLGGVVGWGIGAIAVD